MKRRLPFEIVYEDRDLVAIDKPAGLLSTHTRVQGRMAREAQPTAENILTDYLRKDPDGMVRAVGKDAPGAKLARLKTTPLCVRDGLTLVRVELYTGRAHQIRVQHAHAGFPLWGDARYGGGRPGQQIALWACELGFEHPVKHEPLRFTAPPPMKGAWAKFQDIIEDMK